MNDQASEAPISSIDELVTYFRTAAKPRSAWRVGIEQEKIPVRDDGSPVPYDGPAGIAELLRRLAPRGYTADAEDGHVVALERGDESVTLEPGGQVELSGPALISAAAGRDVLVRHLAEMQEVARELGIRFIAGGFRPFGTLDDVSWLPKRRYAIMRQYLPRKGRMGHEMMKRTATVQANFDFADEQDGIDQLRTAFSVSSVITALFAASPITEGKPNGWKSYRAAVWLDTDNERCGLLPFVFEPGFDFARYVEWALDVPMFFVVRGGVYNAVDAFPFRRFLAEGWRGERATMRDWQIHLSTLFPEVRLKRYIEVRGADAGPVSWAVALPALWRGLLDDTTARAAAWALGAAWSYPEREALRREVPRAGLDARIGGRRVAELAAELCRIAHDGLSRLPEGREDQRLLAPVLEAAARGRCPADAMLEDHARLGGDPAKLIAAWELRADR